MAKIISKKVKFMKIAKKKLLKPICIAIGVSFFIYLIANAIVWRKTLKDLNKPHFVISTISHDFNNFEFMHLLLTIQEIKKNNLIFNDLVKFANADFPSPCPINLEKELYKMHWDGLAFLSRIKKMIDMAEIYEIVLRIEGDIELLITDIKTKGDSWVISSQLDLLKTQKENIIKNNFSDSEYEFIRTYYGVIAELIRE